MPIGSKDALYFSRLHVTDGTKGFHPYVVAIKKNGTYIEGQAGHLLHISLHHQSRADQSFAECHIRIPKENEHKFTLHDFPPRKHFFNWNRKRAANGGFYQAANLIFPTIFAQSKFSTTTEPFENSQVIQLKDSATVIQFWFGGTSEDALRQYLSSFGIPIAIVSLPCGECVGINCVHENDRDYSTYQVIDKMDKFTITGEDGVVRKPEFQIFVGPYGDNCYGVLHGSPIRVDNA